MSGFSTRNLKLMVQFYKEYSNDEFVQPIVANIPWLIILFFDTKIKR